LKQAYLQIPHIKSLIFTAELLVAFAWALKNMKRSNGEGICIVVTSNSSKGGGWEDLTSIGQLKRRLAIVMKGMANSMLAIGFKIK
jgi:hypothetical protein